MHKKELHPKQIALIMAGAMMTLLLAALDNTIVGTAMPKIIKDLHGMEHYSWPFTSYMLFSTIILPISGKLADIYGRKKVTLLGIAVFAAASALCGLSRNMIELSVLRGFQGLGGGICVSSAFIIVSEIFPPAKRGKFMGMLASMFAVASILGPGAGGIITDTLSWRWIFFINIPLSLPAFYVLAKHFPNIKHHEEKRKIDIAGVSLFVLAMCPLLFVISQIGSRPILSPLMLLLTASSAVMLFFFLKIERRSKEPLLNLHFFREKVFTSSVIASSLGNMAIFGAAIYFPLYLQSVRGISATKSGMIMMPMMVSMIISSNISGMCISKFLKFRPIALAGIFISFTGMMAMGIFGESSSTALLIVFSTATGLGIGVTFPIFTVAPQSVFSPRQTGVVTSLLQFFRNLGGSIGSAMFGAIMISYMSRSLANIPSGNIPEAVASQLKNPATLSNQVKLDAIRQTLPVEAMNDFSRIVSSSVKTMSSSIEMIFIVSGGILFLSAACVFLYFNEKHVRKSVEEHRTKF